MCILNTGVVLEANKLTGLFNALMDTEMTKVKTVTKQMSDVSITPDIHYNYVNLTH